LAYATSELVDWTVVIATGITAAVGIAAIVTQGLLSRGSRVQAEKMAREARQQDRRGIAYVELLTALQQLITGVERMAPILVAGSPPDPPPPLGDPELWRLNALTAAFASKDLQEMVRAWTRTQNEFYNAVVYLRQVQQYQQHYPPSETKANFGVTELEQWQKVDALRQDLRDRVQAIGELVQAELAET
jgi:hypothetical protein